MEWSCPINSPGYNKRNPNQNPNQSRSNPTLLLKSNHNLNHTSTAFMSEMTSEALPPALA